jgi:Flp pilus assembly protein TadD
LLGTLLTRRGNLDGAARELQTAVELQPGFGRAQFELGVILVRRGDSGGAVDHFRLAAQGTDPQASAAARQTLQQMGK